MASCAIWPAVRHARLFRQPPVAAPFLRLREFYTFVLRLAHDVAVQDPAARLFMMSSIEVDYQGLFVPSSLSTSSQHQLMPLLRWALGGVRTPSAEPEVGTVLLALQAWLCQAHGEPVPEALLSSRAGSADLKMWT